LGFKRANLIIDRDDPQGQDTVQMVANLTGPSAVPGEEDTPANFSIAPNPTTDNIQFRLTPLAKDIGKDYAIRVTDVNGREVYRKEGTYTADNVAYTIKTEGWSSGTYFVRVTTESG